MMKGFPGMPKIMMPMVDVRDVALAHLNGVKEQKAANQRFLLASESIWMVKLGEHLDEIYGSSGS
jgi:hypothetical protein